MKHKNTFRADVKVSAIVSTYDSAQYMEECLNDLIVQTLYQAGKVEILIIDCNSPGNEGEIVRKYQEHYPNITYVRLTERETLYGAWNIGVQYAHGAYLTNANTDDRHHPECYARLVEVLENDTKADLAYADVYQSMTPNESFEANKKEVVYKYKPYFAPDALLHYQFGCQPMWRKSVHEKVGLFDPTLRAAGDYEFNFRFALAGCKALYINEPLGLFLERTDSLSQGDTTSTNEQSALRKRYISGETILRLYESEGWDVESAQGQIRALHDMVLRAGEFQYPWHPGLKFKDPEIALVAVSSALPLDVQNPTLINNLAVVLHSIGSLDEAKSLLSQLPRKEFPTPIQRNLEKVESPAWTESPLEFCPVL